MDTQHIWEEFSGKLQGFIFSRVNNQFDADDILQDVFRKIHDNIDSVEDDAKIQGWLFRIARNTIIDHYRSKAKNNSVPIDDKEDMFAAPEEEVANLNETVASWLNATIADLPDKYREAIVLTEIEGLTQKELAERLGISLSGAKSRVQRGREKLKEMILDCCHLEFDRLGNVIDYTRNESCCAKCKTQSSCKSSCEKGA
ncbi:RNA polymerase sigma factor SigZ [Alicyclobacillus dauci]|uniref:RNA polymerase sigma factor SigZ n=1 Tax=Alicyclobacillus dauci TaxID=1475485 RepID=A0ABY6Z5J3_9BACL|nr:RNA polymerase sigma factor SigZ [Alicyclobacillus dauci]WAH38130.1 RNA polymerase sigma factor SigZ [Alicyclobacillus dauci]